MARYKLDRRLWVDVQAKQFNTRKDIVDLVEDIVLLQEMRVCPHLSGLR